MHLKTELHRIIGICAGLTFLVIGLIAFFQIRRFHRVEYVEARGVATGRGWALACTMALAGALSLLLPGRLLAETAHEPH